MLDLTNKSIAELIDPRGFDCECGHHHAVSIPYVKTGRNILSAVPEMVAALGAKKPFVLCDQSTWKAAGSPTFEDKVLAKYNELMANPVRHELDDEASAALDTAFKKAVEYVCSK